MSRHAMMMEAFYSAKEWWLMRRENETALYSGDLELWLIDNPCPRLADFMIATRNNY